MKTEFFKKIISKQTALITLSAVSISNFLGCGATPYIVETDEKTSYSSPQNQDPFVPPPPPSSGSGTGNGGGGSLPPLSFTVQGTGYQSVDIQVSTRSKLKIAFEPGVQDRPIQGSGNYPQYAQLGVYLRVADRSEPTPMLGNGHLPYYPAQMSPIKDYANKIPNTCVGQGTSCRVTVTITVERPNNDYWCLNYGAYCNWSHVYETHPWNGTLYVETDDTGPIVP